MKRWATDAEAAREQIAATAQNIALAEQKGARVEPVPFAGMDHDGMPSREELGNAERRAILGVAPRRSRWPEVDELDRRTSDLQRRHGEAGQRVHMLMERRVDAPRRDADEAAAWELAGRKGRRPEPVAEALDRDIAEAERERDGLRRAVDLVLEEKATFVERNRARLVAVAEQQVEAAHERMWELVDELEATRATLSELRSAAVWAQLYPDAAAGGSPPTALIAVGFAKPIRDTLQLRPAPQLQASAVLELLRRDADALLDAATPEQRAKLGSSEPDTAGWAGSPEEQSARQVEMQALVDAATHELGHPPSEWEFESFMRARAVGEVA